MHLIDILLPLRDNHGKAFGREKFEAVGEVLTRRFGGLTAFTRAPAEGVWKDPDSRHRHDDIVIFEVMTEDLDRSWWISYRTQLEKAFGQEEIFIRAQNIERL